MALAGRRDVVDIDIDPLAERSRRRRTALRIGLPLVGVGLIIGFMLGIALYADRANRAGVLGLSDTLLHGLQERIALQVSAYLEPASRAALLAHSMLGRSGATAHAEDAIVFATSVIEETPQVANVLFADALGNFMLVRQAIGAPSGITETKRILVQPASRTVEWTTRDKAGTVIASHSDPADDYDARTRSWFTGARAVNDVFWTGVYVFSSERTPGVTTSVHGPGDAPDVIGIDIKLDAISTFLGGLAIGRTGRAYLVSKSGEMIAGPDPRRILRDRDGQPAPARVEDVGDAGLTGSWDHFRVAGAGTRVIEVAGQRLISIVTPLTSDAQDWLLVISVPETEFSGFVAVNSRRAGLLSMVVAAMALALAALLVRQGLRADRADRAVAERSEAVRQQSAAFARLTAEAGQFAADGTPPKGLAETLAEAAGARRAGVWRLLAGQALRCDDSFEPATGGHVAGVLLSRQEVPALIEALERGEEIDAPDARQNRRTAALHGLLMAPLGSTSLLAVPVLRTMDGVSAVLGLVLLEDARRDPAVRDLARACAALVSLRLPDETAIPTAVAGPAAASPPELPGDAAGLDAALTPLEEGRPAPGQARASVLVLRLPKAGMQAVAHQVACAAQEVAAAHGIPYVKMLNATIVAAAGYTASGNAASTSEKDAAIRLADAAIALREACAGLFEADHEAEFRLGLDAGLVQGGAMGVSPGLFNLWGETFGGAEDLAGSAPAGVIQASEQAYQLLREAFLFRPRGLFYRPGVGESRSYVLAGRA